LQSM